MGQPTKRAENNNSLLGTRWVFDQFSDCLCCILNSISSKNLGRAQDKYAPGEMPKTHKIKKLWLCVFKLKIKLLLWGFGTLMLFLAGCTHTLSSSDLVDLFYENQTNFTEIRDLILRENDINSIGYDNVGEFWSSGKDWINHRPPYSRYAQQEMLILVGLPVARYEQYLNLLDSIGGYRVSKEPSEGRVVIHISKSGRASSGTALNIVYYSSTPIFLSYATYTEIENGWYVEHIED